MVGRGTAGSSWQTLAGTPIRVGGVGGSTLMEVVVTLAHCPAVGVKVRVIFPFKPEGSN